MSVHADTRPPLRWAVVLVLLAAAPGAGAGSKAASRPRPAAARTPWAPPSPGKARPIGAYRCRIVSYAGKWTRHGLSNYMAWRHPNGPLAPRRDWLDLFRIRHDLDVDGDGRRDDDYVASLPFSLTQPLSNPEWPMHMAFPNRRSGRFYGGVSWYVANSTPRESRFYCEMGYNPDHSPPWYDSRAEDHPLQGQANEKRPDSVHRHYWAILWRKPDFLNGGDRGRVTFDETSRLASITTRDYWLGYDDVRMIVQDGRELLISDNAQFDIPARGYKPARGRIFLLRPTRARWARYRPQGHLIHFDAEGAAFGAHEFGDVRAVGWYLAKNKLEGKQSHVKWYGFEADAVVHRPQQPSVNLAMVRVPAGDGRREAARPGGRAASARPKAAGAASGVPAFWIARCEVPYVVWRDVHRYGDAPFHTLEPRYVYRKDGDMGSMLFGDLPHAPAEPVTHFTFYDALAWCNTLSEMEGKTPCYYVDAGFREVFRNMHAATRAIEPPYDRRNTDNPTYETVGEPRVYVRWSADGHRLPTPAEWARADALNGGGEPDARDAGKSRRTTHAVGTSRPGRLGLYDMRGNVWELCWPCGDVFDPKATDTLLAVGGGFLHAADPMSKAASASPYGDEPYDGSHNIGLRPVCREAGLPRPPVGRRVEGAPAWTIRRGRRTGARQKPAPVNKSVLEMVALPGGSFVRYPGRKTITVSALHVAKFPVTYARWKRVYHWALANGYSFSRTGDVGSMYYFRHAHSPDEPVTRVTWHDCVTWCNALSEMEGRRPCFYLDAARTKVCRRAFTYRPLKVSGPELVSAKPHRYAKYSYLVPQPWLFVRWDADGYRLPTEAEFEYALRGGTRTPYFWGTDERPRDEFTWNLFNAGGRTHPVGRKRANPFGLYDLQGNTFEWLFSCDRKRVKTRPAALDTRNPKASPYWSYGQPKEVYWRHGSAMVAGGSWLCGGFNINGPHGVTVDSQNCVNMVHYFADLGFRVVRCKAGTHPRDGREKMDDWPVVFECDAKAYDPLAGAAFRGSLRRDGVYETKGPAKLRGVKWKLQTGGAVRSSPVVVGQVVYVGCEGGHFYAVDARTGRPRWTLRVAGGVTSSACVAGGCVYFGGNDGCLYAVDAAAGRVKWKAKGRGRLTGSPAVAHGLVFMEGAWGFDVKTGRCVWRTGRGPLQGVRDERMTGRLSSLIAHGDRLFQNGSALDIRTARFLFGRGDPWAGQNCDALADGMLYTLNSGVGGAVNLPCLTAKDAATGKTLWSREIAAPGQPVSLRKVVLCSPAVWEGRVFLGFDGGLMFAFDARNGKTLWTHKVGGAIRSSPAVSAGDGLLYFGCADGRLYALDARTGRRKWAFATGAAVNSSPCPCAASVYVGSDDGLLYALH